MKKISRKIYQVNVANTKVLKAISLLVFCKKVLPSSTLSNFSYNKLHLITGLHINTLKKRIKILNDMELIQRVGKYNQHLLFCNVRDKNSNVIIDRISFETVESVYNGLLAMFIVEKQRQKEYVRQLIASKNNPKTNEELKVAKRICRKRGYTAFNDYGISYKFIAKKLGVSLNKVAEIIKYAVDRCMIFKQKHIESVLYLENEAKKCLGYIGDSRNVFASKSNVFHAYANTYSIPSEWEAGMVYY